MIRAPAKIALTKSASVPCAWSSSASLANVWAVPFGSTRCVVRIRIMMSPPRTLASGEVVQSFASPSHELPRLWSRPAIGTRKFSVNSSPRPTTRKMKPIPKASDATTCAGPTPVLPSSLAPTMPSATTPATMSKPAASAVEITSSSGRSSRRAPSALVRR